MRSNESMSRGSISRNTLPAAAGLILPFVLLVALAPVPARADIVRTATSVTFSSAATGTAGPVSASATLWIDGGFLNLLLQNTSTAATAAQGDLLTSFYFGIYSGTTSGTAPLLSYASGNGQVYRYRAAPLSDTSGVWTPPATAGGSGTFTPMPVGNLSNLMATKTGDETWQFRSGLSLVTSQPPLNFGIGTVGNSTFTSSGNNFQGQIVGKTGFGIASAAAEPSGTVDKATYYVSGSALFRFGGIGGTTIDQIPNHAVFGFGSDPDFIIGVPEPAGIALATIGMIAALGLGVRRRNTPDRAKRCESLRTAARRGSGRYRNRTTSGIAGENTALAGRRRAIRRAGPTPGHGDRLEPAAPSSPAADRPGDPGRV